MVVIRGNRSLGLIGTSVIISRPNDAHGSDDCEHMRFFRGDQTFTSTLESLQAVSQKL